MHHPHHRRQHRRRRTLRAVCRCRCRRPMRPAECCSGAALLVRTRRIAAPSRRAYTPPRCFRGSTAPSSRHPTRRHPSAARRTIRVRQISAAYRSGARTQVPPPPPPTPVPHAAARCPSLCITSGWHAGHGCAAARPRSRCSPGCRGAEPHPAGARAADGGRPAGAGACRWAAGRGLGPPCEATLHCQAHGQPHRPLPLVPPCPQAPGSACCAGCWCA